MKWISQRFRQISQLVGILFFSGALLFIGIPADTDAGICEWLVQQFGNFSVAKQSRDFVGRFPVVLVSVGGNDPATGQRILVLPRDTLARWTEFVEQLARVNFDKDSSPLIYLFDRKEKKKKPIRISKVTVDGWRYLGLIGRDGRFNLKITPSEVVENFNSFWKSSGFEGHEFQTWLIPGHRELGFHSSREFAQMIIGRRIPLDDLHALFFHLPDLLNRDRRDMFILMERFLLLEEDIKNKSADSVPPSEKFISHEMITGFFEGSYRGIDGVVSGFVGFNNHRGTIIEPLHGDGSAWLDHLELRLKGGDDLASTVRDFGVSPIFPDDFHWYLATLVLEKVAATWRAQGANHPKLDTFIKDVKAKKAQLAKTFKIPEPK